MTATAAEMVAARWPLSAPRLEEVWQTCRVRSAGRALLVPFAAAEARAVEQVWSPDPATGWVTRRWPKGSKTGGVFHRGLPPAGGMLHLVEGARDVWALSLASEPAVGAGSSSGWPAGTATAARFAAWAAANAAELVVHCEPDPPGRGFARKVLSDPHIAAARAGGLEVSVAVWAPETGDAAGALDAAGGCEFGLAAALLKAKTPAPRPPPGEIAPDLAAAPAPCPAPARRPAKAPEPKAAGRWAAYTSGVLSDTAAAIRGTTEGRNVALNAAVYKAARLLHLEGCAYTAEELAAAAENAATGARLPAAEARATIKSAVASGRRSPLTPADRPRRDGGRPRRDGGRRRR